MLAVWVDSWGVPDSFVEAYGLTPGVSLTTESKPCELVEATMVCLDLEKTLLGSQHDPSCLRLRGYCTDVQYVDFLGSEPDKRTLVNH